MTPLLLAVIGLVAVAVVFDFLNGFHDAANSIATVVSTRVLSPMFAVLWAAFFNFVAAFFGELKVANTMGKGVMDFDVLKAQGTETVLVVIFATLIGSIVWNIVTWYWGLPSSSSHALTGALVGATLCALGPSGLMVDGITKIAIFIVFAPLIGMTLGMLMMVLSTWAVRKQKPARVDSWFRRLQLLSSGFYSFSHGRNDAQKVMGIIAVILYGTIWKDRAFHVPFWVVLLCHAAIALGTFFGGWRIVRTMGHSLTKLQPIGGFAAETGGGTTLVFLASLGIPVSTTHTITGAIVGVGATRGARAVRWGVAARIVWAWIFTMPVAGGIAALVYYGTKLALKVAR